jgi:hypothetical protein
VALEELEHFAAVRLQLLASESEEGARISCIRVVPMTRTFACEFKQSVDGHSRWRATANPKGVLPPPKSGAPAPILGARLKSEQRQRRCGLQPRVARNELPWVTVKQYPNRNAVVAIPYSFRSRATLATTPLGL